MSFSKKKTVLISAGVVLLGTAAYGSLLWWQLQTFDKMGEDLSVRNMGLFALEQERLGGDWLHRDLALRLGFREDDGLSEVFLEMKGRFTPGLFPTIRFTAVPVEDPERAIFVKTNPQASIGFSPLMVPKDAEIRWTKATEGHEVVSDGRIAAKLDVDTAKKVLRSMAGLAHLKVNGMAARFTSLRKPLIMSIKNLHERSTFRMSPGVTRSKVTWRRSWLGPSSTNSQLSLQRRVTLKVI